MVLGLSKNFVFAMIVAVVVSIGLDDKMAGVWIMVIFIIVKIIWRFLTK